MVLLVESKSSMRPVTFTRNIESTNFITSMSPNLTLGVTLEVLEMHIMLLATLFEPTSPWDFPRVVSFAPTLPAAPVWLDVKFIFDLNFVLIVVISSMATTISEIVVMMWIVDFIFNLILPQLCQPPQPHGPH